MLYKISKMSIFFIIFIIFMIVMSGCLISKQQNLHKDITVTIFWVGENATDENDYIANNQSAWDESWQDNYGGIDDPNNRNGFYPKNFVPKENPFYFALPYDNLDDNGVLKTNKCGFIGNNCKNNWIKIIKGDKIAYAQWEDVGPFEVDDIGYVFGTNKPKNKINNNSGLDVSPAVRDYLGLKDIDKISWQFVNSEDVPDGPWKEIITNS